ncbi:unnamed protein product, partial [Heterobilharzia americana]
RPRAKTCTTYFIADNRGHLFRSQDKKPGDCPWGHYVGTWDLPCHYPGNFINNPTARNPEAFKESQKKSQLYQAKLDLAISNKSRSILERRPRAKTCTTYFIADNRGHLFRSQDKKPGDCPWGHYVGTWDLPCHYPGNFINNPTARNPEAFKESQKKSQLYQAKLDLAISNKSRSILERVNHFALLLFIYICFAIVLRKQFVFK